MGALVACDRKTRRRTVVASDFDDGYVTSEHYDLLRLRRRFVALHDVYTGISCKADCPPGYEPTTSSIFVLNAHTRLRREIGAEPDQLVLAVNGGVAWAERAGSVEEIRAGDSDGSLRMLDSGDIDPSTLRIELTIASWIKGGTEYFARLH